MAETKKKKKKAPEQKLYVIYNGESIPIGLSFARGRRDALERFYTDSDVEPSETNYSEPISLSECGVFVFTSAL